MTTKLGPASQKQADFLNSKADITVFGGARKSSGTSLINSPNSVDISPRQY